MLKNRDGMETVHLTIELLRRIPKDSKVTAPELQRQLAAASYQRDLRSIQRHLRQINQVWSIDYMHDALSSSAMFLTFIVLDDYNRRARY